MPPKIMTNIDWTPANFHVIDILPKGNKFNAHLYVSVVLQSFVHWRVGEVEVEVEVEATDQKLIVQADNARFYKAMVSLAFIEPNGMKKASLSGLFPDLAPSSFFLFGQIKGIISGHSFQSANDLWSEIQIILVFIEKLSEWTFWLSRCEGRSTIMISTGTISNDLNNHALERKYEKYEDSRLIGRRLSILRQINCSDWAANRDNLLCRTWNRDEEQSDIFSEVLHLFSICTLVLKICSYNIPS
jgi:hypothetical protein